MTVLMTAGPAAATNLITNGTFSGTPNGITFATGAEGYWAAPGQTNAAAPTGWNVNSLQGGSTLNCVGTAYGANTATLTGNVCGSAEGQTWGFNYAVVAPPGGGNYFAMDADTGYEGPLYQTVSGLTANQFYTLSYYAAADQQYSSTCSGCNLTVTAGWGVNVTAGTVTPTSGTTYTNVGGQLSTPSTSGAGNQINNVGANITWTLESYTFKATSATETISFLANSPEGSGPPFALLSDVSLTATPEPRTFLLLGLGLCSIPALRKLRKTRP